MRVLICEDEPDMNRIIAKNLKAKGYGIDSCFDGEEALYYIENTEYDVVLMDIMMPKLDGFSVVRKMRSKNIKTPVLFLTAKDTITDKVTGLDIGGNDYLVKPFSFEELFARIRVLTRTKEGKTSNVLSVADLTMDTGSKIVMRGDVVIDLSSKEYSVLEYMLFNLDIVLNREQIENHIWNYDYEGGTNLVNVYIRYLRKKIDDDYDVKLIKTVRGHGYVIRST